MNLIPAQEELIKSCASLYSTVEDSTHVKTVKSYGTYTLRDLISWNPAAGED